MNVYCYNSPIGFLRIEGRNETIAGLYFAEEKFANQGEFTREMKKCISQLDEYFRGEGKDFDLKLELEGTEFQVKAWNGLMDIPYGKTCTYRDLATAIGSPKAVRAVGGANHRNKISIIIPCHRVIGADGSLTGYGGGLWRKEFLLNLEKENCK